MNNTVSGSYEYNVICKVCGFKFKASQTRKRWDGLEPVCTDCWEPRHPLDFFRQRDDTHKLPFISSEGADQDTYRVFEPTFDPTTNANFGVNVGTNNTFGTRFIPTVDGYLTEVNVWGGSDEPSEYKSILENADYVVGIWDTSGTLLWSKAFTGLKGGCWNRIPIVPNVRVLNTGDDYTVGIFRTNNAPIARITGDPTVAAQACFTYQGDFVSGNTSTLTFPNTSGVTLWLIDVSMRPD